jgi:chromate transporter
MSRLRLFEVTFLFLRLGLTAFGGPAAHIAVIERECVRQRKWLTHDEFLDLLGVANLIPGPTSTELAMHIGRRHAGWPGLVAAGIAFIAPAALLVGALAAVYVRAGDLPLARNVLAAVQPVVLVVIVDALLPLARSALNSPATIAIATVSVVMALAGIHELAILLVAGVIHLVARRAGRAAIAFAASAVAGLGAASAAVRVSGTELFLFFARTGSLLFGSGYVLLSVLEGDLVERRGWLTSQQLLDAIVAGQATPGPVFTTATFIGYLIGGPWAAVVATVGIFLPAFVFAALGSAMLERLRRSVAARSFLQGVNAAAVALIALVLITLAPSALVSPASVVISIVAAGLVLLARVNPSWVLLGAALAGAASGFSS